MALVMLPCDMPWWPTLQRYLRQAASATTTKQLIDSMQLIHNMCNVGLDPDESDSVDGEALRGLESLLDEELAEEERKHFLEHSLPSLAHRALELKALRPPSGLSFSLQQQDDKMELEREFVASLLANCFFSTFPKRTLKTHPTLQDFNFTNFFRHLHLKHQKCKLLSLLHYFALLDESVPPQKIVLSRKVMLGSQWLTLDDWLQCKLPLCPLLIRRQGSLFNIGSEAIVICSASSRIGGSVLSSGSSMECVQLATCPEMLVLLLCVEALEDNEVILVEGVLQVAKIHDPKGNSSIEKLTQPPMMTVCCMDAEDYSSLALLQHQQDSILRELNKALLGFRQRSPGDTATPSSLPPRRLSPIGESFSSTPERDTFSQGAQSGRGMHHLQVRRKFIVLGSSGECLPIVRHPSKYSSCQSSPSPEQEFHSARSSFTDQEDDRRCSCQLDKEERRSVFAERLKEAMERAERASTESADTDFRMGREGSCGFVLEDESQPEELAPIRRFHKAPSSRYSFTTDYSSELEVVYEQLGKWLDEDESLPSGAESLALREKAVVQFAGNLLKRTLSETFVGVPMNEGELPEKSVKVAARSLSLELARHKSKLAAQLVSVVLSQAEGVKPVATCNWGCSSKCGEPQLKLLIQWLAASVALLPHLVYFTAANANLNKLDTVCRVLLDRQWSVGELIGAILKYNESLFLNPHPSERHTLFEEIIGMEEKLPDLVL